MQAFFIDADFAMCSVRRLTLSGEVLFMDAGIMPIMTYGGFKRMTGFCKTKIPKDVADTLERIKNDEAAVKVGRSLGRGKPPTAASACLRAQ